MSLTKKIPVGIQEQSLLASYCGMENVNLFTFDVVCALYFHVVLAIDS